MPSVTTYRPLGVRFIAYGAAVVILVIALVIGAAMPDNVVFTGVVPTSAKDALLGAADVGLNPVRVGSGTNLAGFLQIQGRASRVLVIDDSLSMGALTSGQSSFERAKEGAIRILQELGAQDSITVIRTSQPDVPLVRHGQPDDEQASRLAELAHGWRSHVNLIPLNPTPGSRWSGTPRARIDRFVEILRRGGVPVTVRDTRGREIEAACGQLHAQLSGRSLREAREAAALPVSPA